MRVFWQTIKFLIVISLILMCVIISALLFLLPVGRWQQQEYRSAIMSQFCRWGLSVMGLRLHIVGVQTPPQNYLIVANHLSYLDILVICAAYPCCFVTSMEIKHTPGLGWMSRLGGCLFVERRSRDNISSEVREISSALYHNLSVAIFPEATSTNGESVLRFRCPLYQAAIDSNQPVLPICINYQSIDGQPLSPKNRDYIFWYGDMDFVSHLWNLMKVVRIDVEINVLQPISTGHQADAKELANLTHRKVQERFVPCITA